jgi:predicted HicB family RNase H-like nuclease
MSNAFEYKGYHTVGELDSDDRCIYGKIIGISDLVMFEGNTVEEFESAFHDSVDDYLEFCAENNKEPNKEYSGQFNVRVSPETHRVLAVRAEASGRKLNAVVSEALNRYIEDV